MRRLCDMNDLYNAQNIVLLAEIIENRFQFIHKRYGFSPRRCNSASTLSSCIEHEMDKVLLALWTKLEHVEIFEKTITGGFSSVNTRLAFDTQILSLNLDKPNQNTDDNPSNKDYDYKVVYNLKLDGKKSEKKSKKFKLYENNQYGHGMMKPLPTGCIKNDDDISWKTFNNLLEKVSLDN